MLNHLVRAIDRRAARLGKVGLVTSREVALAVLRELLNPSDEMIKAGWHPVILGDNNPLSSYTAMIRKAIGDEG